MPSPAWENLGAFFDLDEFATSVEIENAEGDMLAIRAIFDRPDTEAMAGEYEFDTRSPRLTCRSTDVTGIRRGDWATVDGVRYDVLDTPKYDGTGLAVLELGEPA